MRRLAVVCFGVSVAVLGAWKLLPFLTTQAPTVDATPVATPLATYRELDLRPGMVVCVRGVSLGPRSRYLRFLTNARRPTRVRVSVSAGNYRAAGVSIATDRNPLTFAIGAPGAEVSGAAACLRTLSSRPVVLLGIPASRLTSDSYTTVNGKRSTVNATLTVLEKTGSTRFAGFPATVRHLAAISPLPAWLIWTVFLLASVGALAALAYGLGASAEDLPTRREREVK